MEAIAGQRARPRFQFSLAQLMGLVGLCAPVLAVLQADQTPLRLPTLATLYFATLVGNCLFLGWPYQTFGDVLVAASVLSVVSGIAYVVALASLVWAALLVGVIVGAIGLLPGSVLSSLAVFAPGCIQVVALVVAMVVGNVALASDRRWVVGHRVKADSVGRKSGSRDENSSHEESAQAR